ncbi:MULTISPECIES: hypothetical protein [Christiangramia]|uniref:DUF4878 domain-containing protein n=1 Tax=Christiangramia antarctica TaxID=2058158 RepID=A0ABW5X8U3_9FLAO|nr:MULTISPECIES: hypothetical protein [unclassified Christiangramia]MCM4156176.1 hypothetical protein [Gramella sp. AN32]WPZ00085.1 hypothetical protein T8I65_07685 [Christiangramia sp. OXR-203]
MKNYVFILILAICVSCTESQMSPAMTAQKVVESFYAKDNSQLKKYTTAESYESFLSVQDMFEAQNSSSSNFKVLEESIDEKTAWVKFSTRFEDNPETFKLIQEDGMWKVTESGIKETSPF